MWFFPMCYEPMPRVPLSQVVKFTTYIRKMYMWAVKYSTKQAATNPVSHRVSSWKNIFRFLTWALLTVCLMSAELLSRWLADTYHTGSLSILFARD